MILKQCPVTCRVLHKKSWNCFLSALDCVSLCSSLCRCCKCKAYKYVNVFQFQGAGLRQGALMQGRTGPEGKGDEVQISKFSLTDKQRELRDALSKRLVLSQSHSSLVVVCLSFFVSWFLLSESHSSLVWVWLSFFVSFFLFLLSCYCYSVSSISFFYFLFLIVYFLAYWTLIIWILVTYSMIFHVQCSTTVTSIQILTSATITTWWIAFSHFSKCPVLLYCCLFGVWWWGWVVHMCV